MVLLLHGWFPSDRITEPDEDLISDAIRDAALETAALALEAELRYCFALLRIDSASARDIFDQARFDARLRAPMASPFEVRHQAALDVRLALRELCLARAAG